MQHREDVEQILASLLCNDLIKIFKLISDEERIRLT